MERSRNAILALVLGLLGFGIVMNYSSSYISAERQVRFSDGLFFFRKQLIWVAVSLTGLLAASWFPARFWRRAAPWLFAATLIMLAAVLVPGIGVRFNGARRWFRFGEAGLQPSEVAKLTLVLFLASLLDRSPERLRRFWSGTVPTIGAILATCSLVVMEPDVGTAMFLAAVAGLLLLVAGLRLWHLLPAFLAAPVAGWMIWAGPLASHFVYLRSRVESFLNPHSDPLGKGYQVAQSLIAIGSGGTWGAGLGLSKQKLLFLPESWTDFIFAVIAEELGLVGCIAVLATLLILLWRLRTLSAGARSPFGHYTAMGVMLLLGLQAAINVAVVTSTLPNKGIPFPFVSFGGSALVFTCLSVGVALSVTRDGSEEAPNVAGVEPALTSELMEAR